MLCRPLCFTHVLFFKCKRRRESNGTQPNFAAFRSQPWTSKYGDSSLKVGPKTAYIRIWLRLCSSLLPTLCNFHTAHRAAIRGRYKPHISCIRRTSHTLAAYSINHSPALYTVAALHQGAPGQMTWLEDPPPWLMTWLEHPPPWLRRAYCEQ